MTTHLIHPAGSDMTMKVFSTLVASLLAVTVSSRPAMAEAPSEAQQPNVQLWEWGKGIAVESLQQEGMTVYLWFYEWNMFDARAKGQHTRGSHHWKRTVRPDVKEATIDAGDMRLDVRAVRDGAELTLRITNSTDHDWPQIAGIIPCFNPGAPPGGEAKYPKAVLNPEFDNENTWYVGPDGLEKLIGRAIHFNTQLRSQVDAESADGRFVFSHKWPTSPDDAHAGLIVRESTSGKWVTGIAWERFLSAQGHNPWSCMHLCVNVGPLKAGESRTVRGRIYLFPGSREECLDRFRQDFSEESP